MAGRLGGFRGLARCYTHSSSRSGTLTGVICTASTHGHLRAAAASATQLAQPASLAPAEPFQAREQVKDALRRGHLQQACTADERPPVWLMPPPLNLDDAQSAFAKQSSAAMLRSTSVSFLSTIKPLADNANAVLASLKGLCGSSLVNAAIRRTLFAHFCAGETAEEVQHVSRQLRASGIGSILAYSVESDVDAASATACQIEAAEVQRNMHLEKLVESVQAAQTDDCFGFAAVKVTALGQPQMLEALSAALSAGQPPCELPDRQLALMDATMARLSTLATAASKAGVRLLVDAEQSYLQPAIDFVTLELQRQYNAQQPVVYNTFQAYRQDTRQRLLADIARANAEGWRFGAKLVRGAYMVLERGRAAELGYECPVHDTKDATDANYDRCVGDMLLEVAAGSGAEVVVAGHNQHSIQMAAAAMQRLGLPSQQPGIHFAQLMGMCDCATYTLANSGYWVMKYLPYGPLDETLPYLIRRAQENSDIMGGVGQEVQLLRGELWRRMTSRLPRRMAHPASDPAAARAEVPAGNFASS